MKLSRSLSNTLTLILACLGCVVTVALLYEHFNPNGDIGCSVVGGDCAAANESSYGHVGPIPTSMFGLAMYLTVVGVCLKRKRLIASLVKSRSAHAPVPDENGVQGESAELAPDLPADPAYSGGREDRTLRMLDIGLGVLATVSFGISIWLQQVALFKLMSFCPWCMSSAVLVTLIMLLSWRDAGLGDRKLEGEQKLLAWTCGFMAAMVMLIVAPAVLAQIAIIRAHAAPPPHVVPPQPPGAPPIITKDMEVTGPESAPYTIVEFADYQCPHCKKTSLMMAEEIKKSPDRYRLAFRNFPLTAVHRWAAQAALTAEAAGEQGKFWQMHDYLFDHQADMERSNFSVETFKAYATALGLDRAKFEKDVASDKIMGRVAADETTATSIKIQQTPTFYIFNKQGRMFQITGMDEMKKAMEDPGDDAWK